MELELELMLELELELELMLELEVELELELILELELYPDSSLKEQSVFKQIPLNVLSPHAHLLILSSRYIE